MREKLLTLDRTSCRMLGGILLACALLSGCGGTHAEYDPKSPWIGTHATFGPPMAYITNLPSGFSDKEVNRIGRRLAVLERAEDDKRYTRIMRDVIIAPIQAGATFEVIAVFTVLADGYTRMFAPDYDVLVLRDNLGNVSTIMLDEFQAIVKERTGDPSEGSKMNQ
jgi:hypothetical protein